MKAKASINPSFLYLKIFIGIFLFLSLATLSIRLINLIENKTFRANGYNVLLLGREDAQILSFSKDRGVRKMVRLHVAGGGTAFVGKSLLGDSMLLGVPLDGSISSSENFESIFSFKNSVSALFKSSSIKKNRVGDLDLLLMYIAISQTSKDQVQEKNVNVKDLLENRIDPKELSDLFKREEIINAKTSVSIINASGVDGVAKKVALMLSNEGYYVISIDSADIQDPIEITVSDKNLFFNRSYLFNVIPQVSQQTNLEDIKIVIGRNIVKSF